MQPPSDLFEVSWLLLQKLIVGICRKKDLHFNPPPHIPIPTPTDREVPLLFGGIRAAITDLTDEGNHRPIYRTIIGSSSVQLLSILRRLTVDLVYDEDVVSAFSAIFTFDNLTSNKPLPVYILHAASVDIPGMAIINRPALDTVFDEWIDDGMWNLKADSPLDYAFTVLRVAGRWILVVLQPREKTATIYDPENEWTVESFEDVSAVEMDNSIPGSIPASSTARTISDTTISIDLRRRSSEVWWGYDQRRSGLESG